MTKDIHGYNLPAIGECSVSFTTAEQPQYVQDLISIVKCVYGSISVTRNVGRDVSCNYIGPSSVLKTCPKINKISGDSCTQTLTGFSEPLYEKISWYVTFPCWTGVGFQDSVKLYHSPNKAKLSSLMRSGITPRLPFPSTKNQQRHLFIVPSNNVNAIKNEMLLHSKHVHQLQPFAIWLIWMIIRLISKHITYV